MSAADVLYVANRKEKSLKQQPGLQEASMPYRVCFPRKEVICGGGALKVHATAGFPFDKLSW